MVPTRSILALDGPSGVGKSTLLPEVARNLAEAGVPTTLSANNDVALFRDAIRSLASDNRAPIALCLATAAARAHLVESHAGAPLVCDRFVQSSLVYQVFGGVDRDYAWQINAPLARRAVHVSLDIAIPELQRRRAQRVDQRTDWFKATLPLEAEVRLYREAAETLESRGCILCRVDASAPVDVAAREIARFAAPLLRGPP